MVSAGNSRKQPIATVNIDTLSTSQYFGSPLVALVLVSKVVGN